MLTWILPRKVRRYRALLGARRELLRSDRWGMRKPEETVPPDDERFTYHAIWVVEVYTPLHSDALMRSLRGLGYGDNRSVHVSEIGASLARARASRSGGSWFNLDSIAPRDWSGIASGVVKTDLPLGVRIVHPTAYALTPSLTALVMQFVLDDVAALALDRVARRVDFRPRVRMARDGVAVDSPENMKVEALQFARQELRSRASQWVRTHLPGAFSSGLRADGAPTAELVTTELKTPFERGESTFDYMEFAGFRWGVDQWESDDLPAWTLAFVRDPPHRGESVPVIAGKRSDVLADLNLSMYAGDERWALTYRMHEALAKDVALWGASRLLSAYQARLSHIRDQEIIGGTRAGSAVRRLNALREELLRDCLDARLTAGELRRLAGDPREFEWAACDWRSALDGQESLPFLEGLRLRIRSQSTILEKTEERVRDALVLDSALIGVLANLRLQRRVLLITILALAIALGSLLVTVYAVERGDSSQRSQPTSPR